MGLSDFPCPSIAGLWSPTFPARPLGPSPVRGHGISRFSRMEGPLVPEVSDRAGSPVHSPCRARVCCLPLRTTASAPWVHLISRLDTPPECTSVNASPAPLRTPAHDSRSPWLAKPSVRDSSILTSMPVYPGAMSFRQVQPREPIERHPASILQEPDHARHRRIVL